MAVATSNIPLAIIILGDGMSSLSSLGRTALTQVGHAPSVVRGVEQRRGWLCRRRPVGLGYIPSNCRFRKVILNVALNHVGQRARSSLFFLCPEPAFVELIIIRGDHEADCSIFHMVMCEDT